MEVAFWKIVANAPVVCAVLIMWWFNRKDLSQMISRQAAHIKKQQEHIKDCTVAMHKLTILLEVIKDRLK